MSGRRTEAGRAVSRPWSRASFSLRKVTVLQAGLEPPRTVSVSPQHQPFVSLDHAASSYTQGSSFLAWGCAARHVVSLACRVLRLWHFDPHWLSRSWTKNAAHLDVPHCSFGQCSFCAHCSWAASRNYSDHRQKGAFGCNSPRHLRTIEDGLQ